MTDTPAPAGLASLNGLPPVIFVTGTDTGVGKTITTAALATALPGTVSVYKPTQTGVADGEPGDMDEVRRLSGVAAVSEGIRLLEPMAPVAAAGRQSAALPPLADHVRHIEQLATGSDHVLVEGAGGLLVELDDEGRTLADLAARVRNSGVGNAHEQISVSRGFGGGGSGVVVVCRSGLGTLNHTLLTLEALRTRSLAAAGLVIGSWPAEPSAVEEDNLRYLQNLDVPFLGAIPQDAAALHPARFQAGAREWFRLR
ncbi:dethiobiotin synthase [Arthrobacter crystallopoietes]|uniref:ATP-dependent dethiobiotin synthetase BioD n=1 Tax=Crystallibacter crystallopoietes TaxID=37928 RepID=A0A1H1AYB5_9MICC|nr:dethiobiotin synthase [Arthrobacter crystallopoietes]SDQ44718.1 dethiobiotin synthetase [Arthrobacter crystallopoietes]